MIGALRSQSNARHHRSAKAAPSWPAFAALSASSGKHIRRAFDPPDQMLILLIPGLFPDPPKSRRQIRSTRLWFTCQPLLFSMPVIMRVATAPELSRQLDDVPGIFGGQPLFVGKAAGHFAARVDRCRPKPCGTPDVRKSAGSAAHGQCTDGGGKGSEVSLARTFGSPGRSEQNFGRVRSETARLSRWFQSSGKRSTGPFADPPHTSGSDRRVS